MRKDRHCVYILADLTNGKKYVGQTKRLSRRLSSHRYHGRLGTGMAVNKAMFAHGVHNFVAGVVGWFPTREAALAAERDTIAALNTRDPSRGYNLSAGGQGPNGVVLTDEHRKKLSESHKGQPGYWTGKKLPAHVVQLMRERATGRKPTNVVGRPLSAEAKAHLSEFFSGRVFSDEHRARISEGNRRAWSKSNKPRVIGEACGSAKLTEVAVRDIVAACDAGEAPADVAARFGVHRRTISDIVRGKTWAHVTGRRGQTV